jgi:hypothetical protein
MTPEHTKLVTDLKNALAQSHGCHDGDCALLGDMSDAEFAKTLTLFLPVVATLIQDRIRAERDEIAEQQPADAEDAALQMQQVRARDTVALSLAYAFSEINPGVYETATSRVGANTGEGR